MPPGSCALFSSLRAASSSSRSSFASKISPSGSRRQSTSDSPSTVSAGAAIWARSAAAKPNRALGPAVAGRPKCAVAGHPDSCAAPLPGTTSRVRSVRLFAVTGRLVPGGAQSPVAERTARAPDPAADSRAVTSFHRSLDGGLAGVRRPLLADFGRGGRGRGGGLLGLVDVAAVAAGAGTAPLVGMVLGFAVRRIGLVAVPAGAFNAGVNAGGTRLAAADADGGLLERANPIALPAVVRASAFTAAAVIAAADPAAAVIPPWVLPRVELEDDMGLDCR